VPQRDLLTYHWCFWKKSFKGSACFPGVVRREEDVWHYPDTRLNVELCFFPLSLLVPEVVCASKEKTLLTVLES
jgi:hypothetical protein